MLSSHAPHACLNVEGQPLSSSSPTRHRSSLQRNSSSIKIDSSNKGDDVDDDDVSIMSLTDDEEEVSQPSRWASCTPPSSFNKGLTTVVLTISSGKQSTLCEHKV